MASSSNDEEQNLENMFEDYFEQQIEVMYNNIVDYQPTVPRRRAYIERNREEGHNRLWNDYFSEEPTYPPHNFRRRFRMNQSLFTGIVNCFSNEVPYFQHRRDAVGRFGLSPLQKCDMVDEYLRMGETTALLCLEKFTEGIIDLYGEEYLRRPTPEDLQRLLDIGEVHGFLGMIGSIDCILNDINVLDRSPVFDDIIYGRAPRVEFTVNGHKYHRAYYLTDGIYPKWPTFIQSISIPQGPKDVLFAERQEAARKDVERAFGVLQARFAIVRNPALLWEKEKISNIIRACIILHNMIVEEERDGYTRYDISEFVEGETSKSSEVDFSFSTNMPSNLGNILAIRSELRDQRKHERKTDLIENIFLKIW
uniref:DDE Tnp4 domain-containing protein n=1 Tax=Brassica oleracea var. oleracea TaxID=109376 RepID=A0A0D3DCZ4_BRAOL